MSSQSNFSEIILEHIKVALNLNLQEIEEFKLDLLTTLKNGGKVVFFGNGGSATQAAHWAEEFVGRFVKPRRPFPAIALGTNFANITGIGNDFGFDNIFARELEAFGDKKDLAVGISTSGNSQNIIKCLDTAKKLGIKSWILTGNTINKAKKTADKSLSIDSPKTARIQEMHALVIHMIFEMLEEELFNVKEKPIPKIIQFASDD